METLPLIPLEQILTQLNVEDLLACSLVSIKWRAAVNSDVVWKRICQHQASNSTVNHVQAVQPMVIPKFKAPQSSNKQLVPLCYWRRVYLKLQHVKCNWKCSNYNTYSVTNWAYNFFDLKVDGDVLISNLNDNQCAIWNIRGVPYEKETIICALSNIQCKCLIHIYGNRIVIVQDNLLQVYIQEEDNFKLSYRRLFNQAASVSELIPTSQIIDDWYNETKEKEVIYFQAIFVGRYFIGLAENGLYKDASFHVWDILTGEKLKEEQVKNFYTQIRDPIIYVKFCAPKSDLGNFLFCVQYDKASSNSLEDTSYSLLYTYDLVTLTCKKLNIFEQNVPWIYYENQLILIIDHTQITLDIYKSSNGEKIISRQYEEIINPESIQVHGNHLGFSTGGDLVVLDVESFELVFTTAIIKGSSSIIGFDFVLLDWNLVIISRWDDVNKIEVWSMEEKTLLSTLGVNGLLFPCNNNNSAKLFIWNEMATSVYMLQFW